MKPDESDRIGIFRSWAWVYGTVLLYGFLVIVGLAALSRILSHGTGS